MKSISTAPYLSTAILTFRNREELAVLLGVAEVPDNLYRLCKSLRLAHSYNAERHVLESVWETFFKTAGASDGRQATHTYTGPQSPLGEAVRKAENGG